MGCTARRAPSARRPASTTRSRDSVLAAEGYNHVGDVGYQGGPRAAAARVLHAGRAERRQHLRHRLDRLGRSVHAGVPVLREAGPRRDPEGDVGRGLAGRAAPVDLERAGPARVPRRGREPGERRPGRPADPRGATACRRGPAERRDGRGLLPRAPVPVGGAGHDLPGVVGRRLERDAPARAGAAERPGRGRGARPDRPCSAGGCTSWWLRWLPSRPSARRSGSCTSPRGAGPVAGCS